MIADARNGGSITPRYAKRLDDLVGQGLLSINTHTVVTTQNYDAGTCRCTITTDPVIPVLPPFDHVFFATGVRSSIDNLALLKSLSRQHPIKTSYGLPCLTDDLQWSDDVPLFVTGRLAGLQLGPGAGNLEGARLSAERISWAVEHFLERTKGRNTTGHGDAQVWNDYLAGVGSKFSNLGLDNSA